VFANPLQATGYAVYSAALRDDFARDSTFYNDAHVVFNMSETHSVESIFHTLYDCNRLSGIVGNYHYCEGDSIRLEATASEASAYRWMLNDSLISTEHRLCTFSPVGQYTYSLEVSDTMCAVSDQKSIEVFALPSGEIQWVDDALVVVGEDSCQWYLDGVRLPNASGNTLMSPSDGVYSAEMRGNGGCAAWTESFVINRVEEIESDVSLYPNPARSHVDIQLPSGVFNLELIDISGRCVLRVSNQQQRTQFDLASMPRGVYQVRISGAEGVFHRVLVVE
jgi:hypothetical protein